MKNSNVKLTDIQLRSRITDIINRFQEDSHFTYRKITETQIKEAENILSVSIPAQFIWFLQKYGHGGIGGVEIIGISERYGLPKNLIVIENCDEWLYCINCDNGEIVAWYYNGDAEATYSCFFEYLYDRFSDVIENISF